MSSTSLQAVIPLSFGLPAGPKPKFWEYATNPHYFWMNPGFTFCIIAILMLFCSVYSGNRSAMGIFSCLISCFIVWLVVVFCCYDDKCGISYGIIGATVLVAICMLCSCLSAMSTPVVTTQQKNKNSSTTSNSN
jgi:hypothetical protein